MHPNKIEDKNWIIKFLREGIFFGDLKIHVGVENALNILGKPISQLGNEEKGWLLEYGNGIRISFLENNIDELAILFNKMNVKLSVEITSLERTISSVN